MYKTEKRIAKEGETILIVNAWPHEPYKNGDKFKAQRFFGPQYEGNVHPPGMGCIILPSEYEVIVGEETEE